MSSPDEDFQPKSFNDDFHPKESNTKKEVKAQKIKRGHGTEAKRVSTRLAGFDLDTSVVWNEIKAQFSSGITHNELKSVATMVCEKTGEKLDRDASRDNRVLIKWFDERWDKIEPIVKKIRLYDEHDQVIDASRETNKE